MCGCASLKKCSICGVKSATTSPRFDFENNCVCEKCYFVMCYSGSNTNDKRSKDLPDDCINLKDRGNRKRRKTYDPSPTTKSLYGAQYRLYLLDTILRDPFDYPLAQSAEPVPMRAEDTSEDKETNIVFKDNEIQKVLAYGVPFHDTVFDNADQEGSDLGQFMSRPVRIASFPWEVGVTFASFAIAPWSLFLANARIREKINTYKLLSGTLKIKLMLNGSPFHYGRVFVGLRPTQFTNNGFNGLPETTVTTRNYYVNNAPVSWTPQKNFYSQRPHVLLNPAKNIPQEIHWPFFSSTDFIEVNNTLDHARMGVLEIWELNQLQHANGAADPVVISIYAWMEDVKLTGITDVVAQSSRKKPKPKKTEQQKGNVDEYDGKGVVSYPASVVEGIASRLSDVPFIGKFAKATQIGAGAVKDIASMFGFSNPALLDKQCMMTQHQLGRMCQTSGNDPVIKLSLDPKNELTIDPSTVGIGGDDEMSFANIAQREGLIQTFAWTTEDTADHLWGCRVWPKLGPIQSVTGVTGSYWYAPCGFVAHPFEYWTGSLVFRVQVVCSAFHRGRLGIVYTPDINGLTGMSAGYDPVEHFSYIVDISQETDCSFEIKWAQPMSWACLNKYSGTGAADTVQGPNITMADPAAGLRIDNGRLDIYIITDLGAPITTSSVDVNIWLSAGDSFRVANPNSEFVAQTYSRDGGTFDLPNEIPTLQSGFPRAQSSSAYVAQAAEDDPDQTTAYVLNGVASGKDNSEMMNVYMGEDVRSIRSMIKRYCAHNIYTKLGDVAVGNLALVTITQPNFPTGRSGGPYGSSGTDQFSTFNRCWLTYLRYYAQAYVGFRGAIRWKAVRLGTFSTDFDLQCNRLVENDINLTVAKHDILYANTDQNQYIQFMDPTEPGNGGGQLSSSGMIVQPSTNSNAIAYEVPYYHPTRFADIHSDDVITDGFTFFNGMTQTHMITSSFANASTSDPLESAYLRTFCAAGEDASFFMFIGMPAIGAPIFS